MLTEHCGQYTQYIEVMWILISVCSGRYIIILTARLLLCYTRQCGNTTHVRWMSSTIHDSLYQRIMYSCESVYNYVNNINY